MRDLGTVVRGIRTPIIKENDDLESIVVNSVLEAQKNNGFEFHDRDVIAITEAVVGISEGNYVTVDEMIIEIEIADAPKSMQLIPGSGAEINIGSIFGDFMPKKTKKKITSVYKTLYIKEELVKQVEKIAEDNDTSFNFLVKSIKLFTFFLVYSVLSSILLLPKPFEVAK